MEEGTKTEEKALPQISAAAFTLDVNNKMDKIKLSAKYGISTKDVSAIVKQLGLKLTRVNIPKFTLINDLAVEKVEEVQALDASSESSMN